MNFMYVAGVAVLALGLAFPATAQSASLRVDDEQALVEIGGRTVLTYPCRDVPFKPYVKELFTPGGVNVLRDAPSDHLHHHALMYAVSTNDIDFWAELPDCGSQSHRAWGPTNAVTADGLSRAQFIDILEWVPPARLPVVLKEQRTIEVIAAADIPAALLTWQSALSTPTDRKAATLTGHHYHGLGMRFPISMDTGGTFIRATDAQGELVRGDEYLTPGPWCAYTAEADGKPVTVAMFDDPKNVRPALWFTMQTPFSYLSATVNTWREPLEITAEKPVTLRYGVAAWDGRIEKEQIEALYQRWLKLLSEN